ncbi:hypothetical protein CARUB_v10012521mg [Capsella rubella]|uniref:F-box domain-containing protein n=1 Tax=Capsella rubella TaxID=81985 RepID=R0GLT3_9BRAS|nr:hypothetical protein CARUB_v10012521mg [Capsella rubella]
MNGLPLHLLEEILFKMDPKSLAMMRCTNRYFQSYISDSKFEKYSVWTRPSLFHLASYGATYIFCLPLVSSRDSMSTGNEVNMLREPCYIFGSCSGLLLLYIGGLFVVNPLTKWFRLLDHSASKLLSIIVGGDRNVAGTERSMCVGFTVNRNLTTNRFKIVCILEMETVYGFEISDGYSWRLSETTITTSSTSNLMVQMKPVYLVDSLHWLRNDGSIIAFDPDTERNFGLHTRREFKWKLARRIKNVSMKESELVCWNIVVYDGKHLVLTERKDRLKGVVHVYDMEVNSWGVLGSTTLWSSGVRDFYKFTPSLFFVKGDEQRKVIVASNDQRVSYLTAIMGLIDTAK